VTTPASGRGGSTPPRPPAPGRRPQQWFVLRPWAFDVTAALALLDAAPRPARPLPVEPWARAYGLTPAPSDGQQHTVSLIGPGPEFDPDYAMGTDLDEPLLIANIPGPEDEPAVELLIDGCHRLYKAARLGREHLPSLVLTTDETLAIRHDAILGPARAPARPRRSQKGNGA
jgi:hypothetical protein